jgi:two-component sensor histidine kinase
MSGTFVVGETKIRPGVYTRYENAGGVEIAGAANGIGAAVIRANWGPLNKVKWIESPVDAAAAFGEPGANYTVNIVNEMLAGGASKVAVVRAGNGGTAATITLKDTAGSPVNVVTITAKYPGARPFSVTIRDSLADANKRECIIYSGTSEFEKVTFAKGATGDGEPAAIVAALANSANFTATKVADGTKTLAAVSSTALNLHVSAMLDGILPANEENLRAIRYEITRLNRMTEMLKSTFDAQESTDRIHIESVDCTALLNELADSLRPMLNKDRVQITLSVPAELVTETDKEKLRQILYNLLSNAKKAVDQGGRIRIEGHKTKKDIVLTVADDGIGIRSVDLPHIFDRFYRADTARNTKKGGTGLGLAIVKSHIQSLHGTIRVESTPGEGSRFTITLPLYWPGQEKNPASS